MFLHLSVILFTGGCLPLCMLGYTPLGRHPQQMATAADGMHPTGMHSWYLIFTILEVDIWSNQTKVKVYDSLNYDRVATF